MASRITENKKANDASRYDSWYTNILLFFSGVSSKIVKRIPFEVAFHTTVGQVILFCLFFFIIGLLGLIIRIPLAGTSLFWGGIIVALFVLLSQTYLRYINSSNFNRLASLLLLPFILFIAWLMSWPLAIYVQMDDFKRKIEENKDKQYALIREVYVKDSLAAYAPADTANRQMVENLQFNISVLNSFLSSANDSIILLRNVKDQLLQKYTTSPSVTNIINESICQLQDHLSTYSFEEAKKERELQTVYDSLNYYNDYIKGNKLDSGRHDIAMRYLDSKKYKLLYEIKSWKSVQRDTKDSIVKMENVLNKTLNEKIYFNKQYVFVSDNLANLTKARNDAQVQLIIYNDSLAHINKSEKKDSALIAALIAQRDSETEKIYNRRMGLGYIYQTTKNLIGKDTGFTLKFLIFSVIFVLLPGVFLVTANFRENHYRHLYSEYRLVQEKRAWSDTQVLIDVEKLKLEKESLDKMLKTLGDEKFLDINRMYNDKSAPPQELYYITALQQESLILQTQNTSAFNPEIIIKALGNINKAIELQPGKPAYWELKWRLLLLNGQPNESQEAADEFRRLRAAELFQNNLSKNILIDEVIIDGLPFYGSFSWKLTPGINILLGRNGYGKSHFLSIICAILQNDRQRAAELTQINTLNKEGRGIKIYLAGNYDVNREYVRKSRKKIKQLEEELKALKEAGLYKGPETTTIANTIAQKRNEIDYEEGLIGFTPSELIAQKGQVPVLAIPDLRFVNKATDYTDSSINELLKGDGFLKNASYFFVYQLPFESVLQNLLNILATTYSDNKSFDAYIFTIIRDVFRELTGNDFKWHGCESDLNGSFKITVVTDGSPYPIPIQKISQGTFSVLSIIGLIYVFLRKKYGKTIKDEDLVQKQAIVVIDEIDAHLHPLWQQKIINIIRRIFCGCQFIITAHSPLVVAGCKEDEVAVMRDEKKDKNPSGFSIYQFREDFIGSSIESLYNKIFEVEGKDQQYLQYTAMQPFAGHMNAEKEKLEKKMQTSNLLPEEEKTLKQLQEDLYYMEKAKTKFDEKSNLITVSSENARLKATIQQLTDKSSQEVALTDIMKPISHIYCQIIKKSEPWSKLKLIEDCVHFLDKNKVSRLVLLNEYKCAVCVIHRSIIDRFIAEMAFWNKDIRSLTLQDLYNEGGSDVQDILNSSVGFLNEKATLYEASQLMKRNATIRDVFITPKGLTNEAILGWVTNNTIQENMYSKL